VTTYNPLTEAREAVSGLLSAVPGVTVYGSPPEVVTPPCVVVTPGDPWLAALTWKQSQVTLDLAIMATMSGDNEAAYVRLEETAWAVQQALAGSAVCGTLSAPTISTVGQAQVAQVTQTITVQVTDEESP
jgi:hypothetical protein